jgi:hypothetical protein
MALYSQSYGTTKDPSKQGRQPWGQCYKTFYVRKLRFFIISLSVGSWQAFSA